MSDWLKTINAAEKEMAEVAYALEGMAHSFRSVGNPEIAGRLFRLSMRLNAAEKEISQATSGHLTELVQGAQAMSGAVLRSVLAGSALERERLTGDRSAVDELINNEHPTK